MKQRESRISRQKTSNFDLVDRISDLPDSILAVILSFLPTTKEAVSTSILSKRWNRVWVAVPILDLCHPGRYDEQDEGEDMKFVAFVKHVFLHHDVGSINKFSLVWDSTNILSSDAHSWIVHAVTSNVRKLCLNVGTPFGPYDLPELFQLPICVWSCHSLQSLELCCGIFIDDTIEFCFPRLESLILDWIVLDSDEAFEKLISGCPMLEYLKISVDIVEITYSFQQGYDFTYKISSTSLKQLELTSYYQVQLPGENFRCSLKLDAPSLEYLKLDGYISAISVEKSMSSLVEAKLRIELLDAEFEQNEDFQSVEPDFPGEVFCNSFVKAVRAFSCAKALTFSTDAMRALSCASISLSTEFKRLVRLETTIQCCDCRSLRDIIQSSNSLELLTIYQRRNPDHGHVESKWVDVQHLRLRCLTNRLKVVILTGYRGSDDESEMISYLLQHGSVIETMKISCGVGVLDNTKLEFLQKISMFKRKSPGCQIEFL